MKFIWMYLVVVAFMVSCKPASIDDEREASMSLHRTLSYYCLTEHFPDRNAQNHLVFAREGLTIPFCFVLKRMTHGHFEAIYHEVDTMNVLYVSEEPGRQFFFSGLGFEVDSMKWADITQKAEVLLETSSKDDFSAGIVDGTHYTLSYNGKVVLVNKGRKQEEFDEFSKYVYTTIIAPVRRLKEDYSNKE